MKYKRVEIVNGQAEEPIQYVGVYALHWKKEWGAPETAFVEIDEPSTQLSADEWYAKETNRRVDEFDSFDLHICRVVKQYVEYLNQQP